MNRLLVALGEAVGIVEGFAAQQLRAERYRLQAVADAWRRVLDDALTEAASAPGAADPLHLLPPPSGDGEDLHTLTVNE